MSSRIKPVPLLLCPLILKLLPVESSCLSPVRNKLGGNVQSVFLRHLYSYENSKQAAYLGNHSSPVCHYGYGPVLSPWNINLMRMRLLLSR